MAVRFVNVRREKWKFNRDEFFDRVDRSGGPDACWPWEGSALTSGYGTFWRDGKSDLAHREAYEIANGLIPPGALIRHTCDNPPCCNPNHLIPGTPAENMRDMVERDRSAYGEHHSQAKFSDETVAEVISAYRRGEGSQAAIGRRFGMSSGTVYKLVNGKRRSRPSKRPAV